MSEKMQGLVDKVFSKKRNTQHGEKMSYSLIIDGEFYGNGFTNPGDLEGSEVEFTFSRNGNFANIDKDTIKVLSSGGGSSSNSKQSNQGNSSPPPSKKGGSTQDQIMRQTAVKAAVENRDEVRDPIDVIKEADIYFEYFKNGIDSDAIGKLMVESRTFYKDKIGPDSLDGEDDLPY